MNTKEIGDLLKKRRKQLKLRLKDLEDHVLSKSVISRIEKGDPTVPRDKVKYYAEKIGLDLDDLEFQTTNIEQWEEIRQQINQAEQLIEFINISADQHGEMEKKLAKSCLDVLDAIPIPENHPYQQLIHYVRGKAYYYQRKFDRAEKELEQAVHWAEKYKSKFGYLNILPCALNILANISFWLKGVQSATGQIERAAPAFDRNGERQQEYYMAAINNAIFLHHSKKFGDAERIIETILPESSQITWPVTRAALFELLALQKQRNNQLQLALQYALQGLEVAAKSKLYDRAALLLMTIGRIYEDLEQPTQAETSYRQSLTFAGKVLNKAIPAQAYNALGGMYLKQNRLDEAFDAFNQAAEIKDADDETRCDTMLGIGTIHIRKGDHKAAIRPLKEAYKLAMGVYGLKKKAHQALVRLCQALEVVDPKAYIEHLQLQHKLALELEEEET